MRIAGNVVPSAWWAGRQPPMRNHRHGCPQLAPPQSESQPRIKGKRGHAPKADRWRKRAPPDIGFVTRVHRARSLRETSDIQLRKFLMNVGFVALVRPARNLRGVSDIRGPAQRGRQGRDREARPTGAVGRIGSATRVRPATVPPNDSPPDGARWLLLSLCTPRALGRGSYSPDGAPHCIVFAGFAKQRRGLVLSYSCTNSKLDSAAVAPAPPVSQNIRLWHTRIGNINKPAGCNGFLAPTQTNPQAATVFGLKKDQKLRWTAGLPKPAQKNCGRLRVCWGGPRKLRQLVVLLGRAPPHLAASNRVQRNEPDHALPRRCHALPHRTGRRNAPPLRCRLKSPFCARLQVVSMFSRAAPFFQAAPQNESCGFV